MADQNESHHEGDGTPAPGSDVPEIIDAEVVGEEQHVPPALDATVTPDDTASFRQYQQFLEFQKFQEWQRQQNGGASASGASGRPWWKRLLLLLRYKFVRRLLYLFVAIILAYTAINHYLGGGNPESSAPQTNLPGNDNPAVSPVQGTDPKDAIISVYTYIAADNPTVTCALFTSQGSAEFAAANGAPNCTTATHKLFSQITNANAYVDFGFTQNAVTLTNGQAEVSACDMIVTGGPRLGSFQLQQLPNHGWQIDGYQSAPAHCPSN